MKKAKVDMQQVFEIVGDFGAILEKSTLFPIASPESMLPHSKDVIKTAIKLALLVTEDKTAIKHLMTAYVSLADFIPDHEAHILNANWEELQHYSKNKDITEFREYVDGRGLEKWD